MGVVGIGDGMQGDASGATRRELASIAANLAIEAQSVATCILGTSATAPGGPGLELPQAVLRRGSRRRNAGMKSWQRCRKWHGGCCLVLVG
jgi:hypothetical protein